MGSKAPTGKPDLICFGDSLTVGYQSPTPDNPEYRETPYGNYLQNQLGPNHRVVISGLCGELTSEMVIRFRRDVLDPFPQYVIILGGTNDLGWGQFPATIFQNLAKMYEQSQSVGITPIAVTVPSLRPPQGIEVLGSSERPPSTSSEWQMIRSHIELRLELNGLIKDYCAPKKIPCIDLFTETAEPESGLLACSFSNDGLHLSTSGYKRLADLLWEQIFKGWDNR